MKRAWRRAAAGWLARAWAWLVRGSGAWVVLTALSYGLLFVGLWMLRPAWALIAVGGLLWIDLQLTAREQKQEQRHG